MKCTNHLLAALVAASSLACQTKLVSSHVSETDFAAADAGIPWVEAREYDVVIYRGTDGAPERVYYGRQLLLDQVSGKIIDPERPRWQTNYVAWAFADGSVTLTFDELGSLVKAEAASAAGGPRAAEAGAKAAGVPDAVEAKELERLKRELELLETRKKLEEARAK